MDNQLDSHKLKEARLSNLFKSSAAFLIGAVILVALYFSSQYNYLLFHSFAEIFCIVIIFSIFVIAWNSRRFSDNYYLLFIGIGFLYVGGLDLLHTLAYKGMGVFPTTGANLATQLWIATRYLESVSLLAALFFIRRKFRAEYVFSGYFLIFALLLTSIFYWNNFPPAYIDGAGLTFFKVISEYVISFIVLCSIGILLWKRRDFSEGVVKFLVAAMIVTICTEMAFTLYVDVYGIANMVGHFLAILSFYFIYKAIIETGFNKPYNLLFYNLKLSETGLAQQTAELKRANEQLAQEISERKKAESEVTKLNDSLVHHAADLEAANNELESFAYSVSHDLRAPLRGMSGYSQILLEDYAGKLDEQAKQYLTGIRDSGVLMSQLIDDLLKLSRVTREELIQDRVDITGLATGVLAEMKKRDPERKIEFKVSDGLTASGDNQLLRIVLENLLGNAWKFTGKVNAPKIEVGSNMRNGIQVFFVRDNGAGFDMTYADKLFRPFQRLHSSQEFSGTGIGLATVQRIIQRHGGKVWAEGQPGNGATFYFTLH